MGEKEWDPANVFDLFGDDLTRQILVLASERPLSAEELATHLDSSLPTVYRRVNALREYDLVKEHQQIGADGNHYKTIETTLSRISLEIEDGGYNVDIEMRRSLVDQFGEFWSDLGQSTPSDSFETRNTTGRKQTRGDSQHG